MVLQRKGSATISRSSPDADAPKEKRKRGNASKLLSILWITALSVIVIGSCAILGFRLGEHIADNYVVEKPLEAVEEEDHEYAQLLKYPPLKERRGIRRTIP